MPYGYAPQYADEQEYSESDCPSETHLVQQLTSDVKELYRNKQQQALAHQNPGRYYHAHLPGYYEQHARLPTTCACNLPPNPGYYYYKGAPPANQEAGFRSSPQISPNLRTCPDTKPTSAVTFKKYPITARTPRYFRYHPPAAQLCKRPSTLCLPVTCQPDPAVFHRPRKASTEIQHYRGQEASYAINDYVMSRTTAVKRTDARPVDSEGDVNSRLNDLENLLTNLDDDEGVGNEQVEMSAVADIAKILKPKVPSSVKAKQDKVAKLKVTKTNLTGISATEKINRLEAERAPAEPLEALLQRFHSETPNAKDRGDAKEKKEPPKPRTKTEVENTRIRHGIYSEQKPPLDDTFALELHKSKSYIVSLIDKALSKELGTVPGDKCTKEFLNMSPKKAVDLVNRHSSLERLTGFEDLNVAQASGSKKDQCACRQEEPTYLKQLKQLRWSHLRHIQREAQRLADLERFLDSFSDTDNAC